MRIIFVRHGHPDYKLDCLTELGHKHGQAVAQRLKDETVTAIYSSSKGRALQTAAHIAEVHNLEVIPCDFIREIGWGSKTEEPIPQNGHPWFVVDDMIAANESLLSPNWAQEAYFCNNKATDYVSAVQEGIDQWLSSLGYDRDGHYYRVREKNDSTVVMVSHGGASSAALARMFNLPFPVLCEILNPGFTGIHIVRMNGEVGSLISPNFELANDGRHIAGVTVEATYDQ